MSLNDSTMGTDMLSDKNITDSWKIIFHVLLEKLNDVNAISWLEAVVPIEVDSGMITLGAPTRFARDWIRNNLQQKILAEWQNISPHIVSIDIIVGRKKNTKKRLATGKPETGQDTLVRLSERRNQNAELIIPLPELKPKTEELSSEQEDIFDEKYTFSNFITGPSNELAYAAAKKIADGRSVTFNPLFFHGGVGLGKTHLMHAIALEIKEKHPKRRVIYLSAEQFMYRFVTALRNYDMQAFKEEFRSVDILLIDDLQFISGKNSTQEEFFHTFNALVDSKKQIVISADRSPNDMGNMEERIRSRLSWGLVVDIHQTDYSLRIGILRSKIKLLQTEYPSFFVPDKVTEYLAHYITGNIRELEGAINRIAAHATFTGRPVTMEMTEDVISDLLRMYEKKIGISEIQRKVAEYYHIKSEDMNSDRRTRDIARPRQIAMYLTKTMTGLSLPEIGRKFGGKDHTTVLHAVRRIQELITEDNDTAEQIRQIKNLLKSS